MAKAFKEDSRILLAWFVRQGVRTVVVSREIGGLFLPFTARVFCQHPYARKQGLAAKASKSSPNDLLLTSFVKRAESILYIDCSQMLLRKYTWNVDTSFAFSTEAYGCREEGA